MREKASRTKPSRFSGIFNTITNVSLITLPFLLIFAVTSFIAPGITKGIPAVLPAVPPIIYPVFFIILVFSFIFIFRLFSRNPFKIKKIDPVSGKTLIKDISPRKKKTRSKK
jgi:hypothetical protein